MRFSFLKNAMISFFAILVFVMGAAAQTGNSSVRGTVLDPKGASVADATITITDAEQGITLSTKSDKDGAYQFLEVRPGTYVLTVSAAGFANYKQTGLVLLVATPTTNDIKMQLAGVATTVEVVTASQTINTTDATIGNAFNQTQISALPFEGRDPTAILSLQPGVVTVADRGQVDLNQDSRGGSVNGARSDQTNVTLDGVDNNDQLKGFAFTGALRATLDSIEEFRVTTTNAGVDQGRSSGAQVQLVTKSGSNQIHGAAYEYHRPKNLVANDYFNKHSQEQTCLQNGTPSSDPSCNTAPSLLRNTFGGSFGGPIKKDRLFYFLAYEGQRTRENQQVTREVPSTLLRQGIIEYQCSPIFDNNGNVIETAAQVCPSGTKNVQDFSGQTVGVPLTAGLYALGTPDIATMDSRASDPACSDPTACPVGPSVNSAVIATLNQYPQANSNQLGYGYNFQAFTFSSPAPNKLDTYVAKIDYNLNQSGTQRVFVRLGLQNDHSSGAQWFPGQPPATVDTNNSKGAIAGYTWVISPTKVNSLHYGFIRQGIGNNGSSQTQFVILRGLADPTSNTRSTNVVVPVHNLADDYSWTRGKHTFQFGGNWRFVNNLRSSNAQSFSDAITNVGFLPTTGFAGKNTSLDPHCDPTTNSACTWSFPAVDHSSRNAYDFPMAALAGIITEVDATYQNDKNGNSLATPANPGAFIKRHFRANETEFYAQDSWHLKSNLTFTYGLRYSLLQPPYETNGNQVAPNISLDKFFQTRMADMTQGISYSPNFQLDLAGQANGKRPYWDWDYKNAAPRVSLAWSPGYKEGLLASLFGGPGKSSIRIGAGVYYDHFGQGITNTFDKNGSFGLATTVAGAPATVNVDTAPRYTGISDIPASITPPGPTGGFPVQPPTADQLGGFAIYWGLNDKLKTPYSYAMDLSFSRELKGGFVFEAAYVGRIGRRLLQEKDLAQPQNLTDPKSGLNYFQALTALAKVYRTGVATDNFSASQVSPAVAQYWADILQPLQAGGAYQIGPNSPWGTCGNVNSTTSAVVAAYDLFCAGSFNETTPLFFVDVLGGIPDATNDPNCGTTGFPACVNYTAKNGSFSFYQSQFASLYAWTSSGRSNYNAAQFSLRKRATHGLSFDFNYTYSKSIDMTSDAERVNLFEGYGFGGGQIINSFDPGQSRAVSDYDMTHQFNTNWVYELPFGRGMELGKNWGRGLDAILGGWTVSGLARWSSGLPFVTQNGFDFPTNWELNGFATFQGQKPKTGAYTDCDGDPNIFAALDCKTGSFTGDPSTFILGTNGNNGTWRFPFPGEAGNRNNIRGQGYFGIDASVRKTWSITERQKLAFSAEAYNVTNSVRFDAANAFPTIDSAGSFGKYSNTLTRPRVLEFSLRYSF